MTVERKGWLRVKRKTIESYRVAFSYRGAQCREHIVLPHTKGNDTYVMRLRAEILGKIARNDFTYADYFPESARAGELGRGSKSGRLKDLLEAYRDRVKATLQPSTFAGYRKSIDNKLVPHFGKIKVTDLRASDVREWVGLQTTSLKTIANDLLPLRAVMDEALEDELVKVNPVRIVRIAKLVPTERRTSSFEADPFTLEELTAVWRMMPQPKRAIFKLWAFTGLRTGELIGLRWGRVDLEANTIRVQETTTVGKEKAQPKTKAGIRTIELLPAARQALDQLREWSQLAGERVLPKPGARNPGQPWDYDELADAWKSGCLAVGVRYRNPYQLRHTFASQLLSDGRPPAEIAALLGHKTIDMVIRNYGRWVGGQPAQRAPWGTLLVAA